MYKQAVTGVDSGHPMISQTENVVNAHKSDRSCRIQSIFWVDILLTFIFITWCYTGEDKVDVLMNNAGVMMLPEGKTVDGYETQFATNVLGTIRW